MAFAAQAGRPSDAPAGAVSAAAATGACVVTEAPESPGACGADLPGAVTRPGGVIIAGMSFEYSPVPRTRPGGGLLAGTRPGGLLAGSRPDDVAAAAAWAPSRRARG